VRRLAIVLLIAGCRCRGSGGADGAPPARPADVVCEAFVPDPGRTWDRARDMLGLAALAMPHTSFALFARALRLPSDFEKKTEPRGPVVAVLAEANDAVAWKLGDPGRFEGLRPPSDGVRWMTREGERPVGLVSPFLVSGSAETFVSSHAPYLTRVEAKHGHDARIEVVSPRSKPVVAAIARVEALLETLDEARSDAPAARADASRSLHALMKSFRGWEGPVRIDLDLGGDALTIAAGSANKVVVPGEVIRWWVRARAGL
jgi:hypothetical protein